MEQGMRSHRSGPALHSSAASSAGFTLIELVLVITILAFLLFLVLLITTRAIGKGALESAESILVQSLRRAQTLAQQNVGGTTWGVHICPGKPVPTQCGAAPSSIVLFQRTGSSRFNVFNATTDQPFEINSNIAFSGDLYLTLTSVDGGPGQRGLAFTMLAGEPVCADAGSCSGTITLTMEGLPKTITVSGKGVVEY